MIIYIKNCFSCMREFSEEVIPTAQVRIEGEGIVRETVVCHECVDENEHTVLKWIKNARLRG